MGAWGFAAWDNDTAADWFADLFDATKLASRVEKTLKKRDIEEYHEEIRAAAYILVALGQVYIWPGDLDRQLRLAIEKLEAIKRLELFQDDPGFLTPIDEEIAVLRSRLKPSSGENDS